MTIFLHNCFRPPNKVGQEHKGNTEATQRGDALASHTFYIVTAAHSVPALSFVHILAASYTQGCRSPALPP